MNTKPKYDRIIGKLKPKQMKNSTYEPGKERPKLVRMNQPSIETYIPDEIIQPQNDISRRVGEVIYPQDRAGEIVRLSNEMEKLRQNQLAAIQGFEAEQIPNQLPMHTAVAQKYNEIQMQQLQAMQKLIEAQKKAKLNETKAGNLNAAREVSEFNRNRLIEYSKAGAKSMGNIAKYLGIGAGATALWVTRFGLDITKETFKAAADIWYSLWGAYRDYRDQHPNQDQI